MKVVDKYIFFSSSFNFLNFLEHFLLRFANLGKEKVGRKNGDPWKLQPDNIKNTNEKLQILAT
jgi:hypothetical protein